MKSFVMIAVAALLAIPVNAALLTTSEYGVEKEGVKTSKAAVLQASPQETPVSLMGLGSGLRKKRVLLTAVKVYVAEILSSEPQIFVRTEAGAYESLKASAAFGVKLSFLRVVEADKIFTSFRDAFTVNSINSQEGDIATFLGLVSQGGDASQGTEIHIGGVKNSDGTETLHYQGPNGLIQKMIGADGLGHKIRSLWLGVPVDNELKAAKLEIISGN